MPTLAPVNPRGARTPESRPESTSTNQHTKRTATCINQSHPVSPSTQEHPDQWASNRRLPMSFYIGLDGTWMTQTAPIAPDRRSRARRTHGLWAGKTDLRPPSPTGPREGERSANTMGAGTEFDPPSERRHRRVRGGSLPHHSGKLRRGQITGASYRSPRTANPDRTVRLPAPTARPHNAVPFAKRTSAFAA